MKVMHWCTSYFSGAECASFTTNNLYLVIKLFRHTYNMKHTLYISYISRSIKQHKSSSYVKVRRYKDSTSINSLSNFASWCNRCVWPVGGRLALLLFWKWRHLGYIHSDWFLSKCHRSSAKQRVSLISRQKGADSYQTGVFIFTHSPSRPSRNSLSVVWCCNTYCSLQIVWCYSQ